MDMYTLHVEHAVLLGMFTVLTLINCRLHHGTKGVYWFPAFTLVTFIGAVLIALRGKIPDPLSVVYGLLLFHVGYFLLHRGLLDFLERGDKLRWTVYVQGAAVGVAWIGLVEYGTIHPNVGRRVALYCAVLLFQMWLTAWVLFRNTRSMPGRAMGTIVGLLGVNDLVRGLVALNGGMPSSFRDGGLSLAVSLLGTTVLQGGIVVAFVWMTAEVLHDQLDQLASTDSLTGLLNRRALEVAAQREIALSRKSLLPMSAVLIDLDHFKQINDSFGHPFGDRTLKVVARCLQTHMRKSDLLARVGGDEFAVMLHNTAREEAMVIAERLRLSLEELLVVDGDAATRVSASIGLAQVDGSMEDWNGLMGRCDKAMYTVKQTGGNMAVTS